MTSGGNQFIWQQASAPIISEHWDDAAWIQYLAFPDSDSARNTRSCLTWASEGCVGASTEEGDTGLWNGGGGALTRESGIQAVRARVRPTR